MSWTDEEIDKLFGDASAQQTFEYRPEYWKDIEKQLPVNKKRKPVFWWMTGGVFLLGIIGIGIVQSTSLNSTVESDEVEVTSTHVITEKKIAQTVTQSKDEILGNATIDNGNVNSTLKDQTVPQYDSHFATSGNSEIKIPESNFADIEPVLNEKLNKTNTEITEESITQTVSTELIKDDAAKTGTLAIRELNFPQQSADLVSGKLHSVDKKRSYYLELNGGLGQTWMKDEDANGSVNASLGLAGGMNFPINKFILSAGLGFQFTKLESMKINERAMVYSFGSSILENNYKINSVYSLNLPVYLTFNSGRHSVSAGAIASVNLFDGLQRSQSINGTQTQYSKGYSNLQLINRFGFQPSLSYGYFVNENLQIGVKCNVQLLQPVQSERFTGSAVKLPFDGQFYLKRTLNF